MPCRGHFRERQSIWNTDLTTIYDFSAKTLTGQEKSLADFSGQVLVIVNVASKCGFTPQYTGLEALYRKYAQRGFSVLGFPCNQFGSQEPGNAAEIASFCSTTYDVTFPMFGKIDVNGASTHPLYAFIKSQKKGLFGSQAIKWNFTKFLIDRSGRVAARYASTTKPADLEKDVEKLLSK
jgi:glutathione peroxidase